MGRVGDLQGPSITQSVLDERRPRRFSDLQADAVEDAYRGTHGGALIITVLEAVLRPHARAYYVSTNIGTLASAFPITIDGRTNQSPRAATDGPTDGLPELGQLQPFFAASLCDFG